MCTRPSHRHAHPLDALGAILGEIIAPDEVGISSTLFHIAALAEAQATAEALGHSERVTCIHDDAATPSILSTGAGRAEVLQVAYTALKPDGYLIAPLLTDPISEENLHSAEGRQYAMSQLMYGGWGIPRLSATVVKAEIEAAGFINVQVRKKPFLRLIVAQRSDKAKTLIMAL